MVKMGLKISDGMGNSTVLTRNELDFFGSEPSASKAYHGLFVVRRMLQNRAFRALFLFANGAIKTILGIRNPVGLPISWDEYYEILLGTLGFRAEKIHVEFEGTMMVLAAEPKQCLVTSIIELNEILLADQYNVSRENMRGRTVIDAGANLGVFSIYAARLGAKKVYAFEPIAGTCEQLRKNVSLNGLDGVVVPCNMALGDKKGRKMMFYDFAGDAGASFGRRFPKSFSQTVDVATIDGFMRGKGRLDFIKIDAEGYEEKILLGARGTIRRHKPVLSFSAYHKPDDITRLPLVVRGIRKDYKCELLTRFETDFYCE